MNSRENTHTLSAWADVYHTKSSVFVHAVSNGNNQGFEPSRAGRGQCE